MHIKKSLLALSVSSILLAGCQENKAPGQAQDPLPAEVIQVAETSISTNISVLGQLKSSASVEIKPRIAGHVERKAFNDGDFVEHGAVLFEIESEHLTLLVAKARAQELSAKADLDHARLEANRVTDLFKANAISQQALDKSMADLDVAKAQLDAAIAGRQIAEKDLRDATIRAPFAGRLGQANVSVGDYVSAQTESLVRLIQVSPVWVEFALSFDQVKTIFPNGKASGAVEIKRENGESFRAEIVYQASEVNTALGTIAFKAEAENLEGTLLPGEYVTVSVTGAPRNAYLLPQGAVMKVGQGHTVMLVKDGVSKLQDVQAGQWQGSEWVINSGLADGDQIIVGNLNKVRPGMPIAPIPQAKAAEGKAQ